MIGGLFTAFQAALGTQSIQRRKQERLAEFADAISEIGEVKATCKHLGISVATGTVYMAKMRRDLGRQAQ